jgi:uncharacterized Zn finger protein
MAVVDLRVAPGRVDALVQGSRGAPYKVQIKIAKIKPKNWQQLKKRCQAELSSLPDLLAGKFPKKLQDVFMIKGKGMFPEPAEISFDCSCPDWADMCKHVAATLYGVGARLDEDPALFFSLRKVDMQDLVGQAVQSKTDAILAQPAVTGERIIDDDQVSGLFGIELEDMAAIPPALPKKKGKTAARKKSRSENAAGTHRKKVSATKKRVGKQKKSSPAQTQATGHGSMTNLVLGCIEESGEEGILIRDLADITGIPAKQLYPVLHRLKKAGYVHNPARGRYCRL